MTRAEALRDHVTRLIAYIGIIVVAMLAMGLSTSSASDTIAPHADAVRYGFGIVFLVLALVGYIEDRVSMTRSVRNYALFLFFGSSFFLLGIPNVIFQEQDYFSSGIGIQALGIFLLFLATGTSQPESDDFGSSEVGTSHPTEREPEEKFRLFHKISSMLRDAPPPVRRAWQEGWTEIEFYPNGYHTMDSCGCCFTGHPAGWYGMCPESVRVGNVRFTGIFRWRFICDPDGGQKRETPKDYSLCDSPD